MRFRTDSFKNTCVSGPTLFETHTRVSGPTLFETHTRFRIDSSVLKHARVSGPTLFGVKAV